MKEKLAVVLVCCGILFVSELSARVQNAYVSIVNPFAVYIDNASSKNHFYPSGWIGDYGDIKLVQNDTNAYLGSTCIKISYSAKASQNAKWAAVYWQFPSRNWGESPDGFNLTGARKLTFYARGERGGEKIAHFKIGGIGGEYPDSDSAQIGPIELTRGWRQYTIDLRDCDLTKISGGFCVAFNKDDNPSGFTIYLDEIVYQ